MDRNSGGRSVDDVDHRWPELAEDGVTKVIIGREAVHTSSDGMIDTRSWSKERIQAEADRVKSERLDWDKTTGAAKKWWEKFETENQHRLALLLRLAEELRKREASITEFFLSYVYANTDNIQANLRYLDYTRLKKKEERNRRKVTDE